MRTFGERATGRATYATRPGRRYGSDHAVEVAMASHHRTGVERPELEHVEVEELLHLGVGGQQHLEATVEGEPVDSIAADPAADSVGELRE